MAKVVGQIQNKGPEPRFQPLTDQIEIRRLFAQVSSSHPQVDVQFSSISLKFRGRVLDPSSAEKILIEVPAEAVAETSEILVPAMLEPSAQLECMLIVYLKGLLLLGARSTQITLDKNRLTLSPPFRFFKIQRRKEQRLEIPSGYDFFVTIDAVEGPKRRVQKRLLDMSSSGMGFQVVSPREAAIFKAGTTLRNCTLQIQNREFTVDLEVCNLIPIPQDRKWSGTKVGCKIVRALPDDADFLSSYVTANIALWR